MKKRVLSLLLSAVLLLGALPLAAAADEYEIGLCEHHTSHTPECGFSETTPCAYICEICGSKEPEAPGGGDDSSADESIIPPADEKILPEEDELSDGLCEHHTSHTPECGFSETTPCAYICEICGSKEPEASGGGDDSSADEETIPEEDELSDGLCGHHTSHTVECGATEGGTCTFVCRVCPVQALLDALPTPEKTLEMTEDERTAVREQAGAADAAYQALDADEQNQISGAENMSALLEFLNGLEEPDLLSTAVTEGYDRTVVVGPDGSDDIQSALDSLPEDSGSVYLRVDQDIRTTGVTTYNVPADKGITSLTVGTLSSATIGRNSNVLFFANGVPLVIDKGVTFASGAIYGGGDKNAAVNSGTRITVNSGAEVSWIYGGGRNSSVTGDVHIEVNGSVDTLYGGGEAHALNDTFSDLQANVTGGVSLYVNSPQLKGDIYGGGYALNVSGPAGCSLIADVSGEVSITIGGETECTSPTSGHLYGGGRAEDLKNNAELVSARVYGSINIDASADNHATSGHDDWDNSMFMSFYGGGSASGDVSDASVSGTHIVISRKAIDDERGLFGGGYAQAGGTARVTGDTYVEVCRAKTQDAGHDNAKAVYGGGLGDYGDASVEGNTVVVINPDITFEPGAKTGPHGGGKVNGSTGVAKVGGTASVIINGTDIGVVPGGLLVDDALAENCAVNAATVQLIGDTSLSLKSGGPIAGPLQVVIGDGTTATEVKTNYIYCKDGLESRVAVRVTESAALVQNTNANQLLFNVTDLEIARGGSVVGNCTKDGVEYINGALSGEGELTLPATRGLDVRTGGSLSGNLTINMYVGKVLTVYGGFTGNTAVNLMGNPQAGTFVAWTKTGQSGSFTYPGEDLVFVTDEADPWYKWSLAAAKKVAASVSGSGGTVSPELQTVTVGDNAVISLTPDPGYKIDSVTANGTDRTADVQDGVLTLENIQADTDVSVTFKRLTAPEVEDSINALPNTEVPDADEAETILDVKMDYEALPEDEEVAEAEIDQLNAALARLPEVEAVYSGNAVLENPETLLDTMTGEEAALLKAGSYTKYRVELLVTDSRPESGDQQSSVDSALNGATAAVHNEATVRKLITSSDDSENPREELITQLPRPIRLVFSIPAELRTAPENQVRSFTMLRTHLEDGLYTTAALPDEDTDAETYTVSSDQFSLYTLAYTDEITAFRLTADAGEGGTISPGGTVKVAKNAAQAFTVTADVGYHIKDVLVDGKSVGNVNSYTFTDITADHSISAVFEKDAAVMYQLTADAGEGGTISPGGTVKVAKNAAQAFTVTADSGYHIKDVLVDGKSVGNVNSYTFTDITADHSISAVFEKDAAVMYQLTADAGEGGTISPGGTVKVAENANQAFTVTADSGYHIKDVLVDGKSVGNVTSYTFTDITANHSISAVFEKDAANPTVKPESTPESNGGTPSTGDSGNPLIGILAVISSGGLAAVLIFYKRKIRRR